MTNVERMNAEYQRFADRLREHFARVPLDREPPIDFPFSWFRTVDQIAAIEGRDAWDVKA